MLVKKGPGPRLERISEEVYVAFDELSPKSSDHPPYVLVGLNQFTLAAVLILAEVVPVVAIVSSVHVGKNVFGVPVVAHLWNAHLT